MSLRDVLRRLAETEGVLAAQVATRDGLPVEMIGHGMRTDVLAAEAAGVLQSARSAADRLMLGNTAYVAVALPKNQLLCFPLDRYLVAVVVGEDDARQAIAATTEFLPKLAAALAEPT